MGLSCEQLRESKSKPKISDISLILLSDYYEKYLMPFIYTYKITTKNDNVRYIKLRFDSFRFCHLLGIESIVKANVNREEISQYRGENGWNNIKSESITINSLRKINKGKYKSKKDKMVFFYLIPRIIDNPRGVIYSKEKVSENNTIECKILFYDEFEKAYVHLGIDKDNDGIYYPRTFFIERVTDKSDGKKYINNQDEIKVVIENRGNL